MDVRNSSLTGLDIKNRSLTPADFRGSLVGRTGAQGPPGNPGPPGPLLDTLPSGRTLKGAWSMGGKGTTYAGTSISFQIPLASSPALHVLGLGEAATTECPGTPADPKASPGHLCVYEGDRSDTTGKPSVCGADKCGAGYENRLGASLAVSGSGASAIYYSIGTWAVTAP